MFRYTICIMSLFFFLMPLLGGTLLTSVVVIAAENPEEQKMVNMDFDQVDLKVFIKFISKLTGKNFVVDDKVQGKVTILSPSPITVAEAYKVVRWVLEGNGC